jgi:hypothetical protein
MNPIASFWSAMTESEFKSRDICLERLFAGAAADDGRDGGRVPAPADIQVNWNNSLLIYRFE